MYLSKTHLNVVYKMKRSSLVELINWRTGWSDDVCVLPEG